MELVTELNRYTVVPIICTLLILAGVLLLHTARSRMPTIIQDTETSRRLKLRFRALTVSVSLLIFLTGIAVILACEASISTASTTPPTITDIRHGSLARFSRTSWLRGFPNLELLYSAAVALFLCASTTLLVLKPVQVRSWIERRSLRLVGACEIIFLAAVNFWAWWDTRADADGPNVILISVDTLRADHLKTYGNSRKTAPNITHLAETGVVFSHAYSQGPWTLPSMASLHTGPYPHEHGAPAMNRKLHSEETRIAEALKNIGYFTVGITSAFFSTRTYGVAQGFGIFDQSQI
jgi:hypothetical protein